ncbi:MAG TPA: S8 family serine peptidase [Micromonosporaceae bacterium]|nr:S8 family serine peptidase [Micromonosporaceae bacterium]
MSRRFLVRAAVVLVVLPPTLIALSTGPGHALQPSDGTTASVRRTEVAQEVAKPATAHLAKSDPALLNQTGATPVQVVVKLDYAPTAIYRGDVAGYPATSPRVTGRALSRGPAEQRYEERIAEIEDRFLEQVNRRVKAVTVGQRLRTVYGGLVLTVPASSAKEIAAISGVVAVQKDEVRTPLTDASPDFIGANRLYPALGGVAGAGKGVIVGVLDTGVWPEHPSFAANAVLGAPPPRADGKARACEFGDNPLTPAADPFVCNNKLIGGQAFMAGYAGIAGAPKYPNARDSEGHGTHTATTAAGAVVASASLYGVDRGPVQGVAPGAWVMAYKVCGVAGCVSSDSALAIARALEDGVSVINFSVSGGTSPATDVVELAFQDAYAAGVFVAASAGNDGPKVSTTQHLAPWVTTVAASTQRREFRSTLTVTAGSATATFGGVSVTAGAGPAPIVLAQSVPGYTEHPFCDAKAPSPTAFAGKIVACRRGVTPRVAKGRILADGGAVGMVLYNPALADVETDSHWVPTVHLADGTDFTAFLGAHPGATATFTAGRKADGAADVMAAFSSRGPGGNFIKPDITAPGVQILAGHTPTPEAAEQGPAQHYYQAVAGTSMSAPHIAGAAALLRALHPGWSPGQIKSAMMTTATAKVLKEDLKTPADPFDHGSGRVRVDVAGNPGLTFDESAERMKSIGASDAVNAVHLNQPSVNAPTMPGRVTTTRRAVNVTGQPQLYRTEATAPAGSSITVHPRTFTVAPGAAVDISITIRSGAPTAQYFGEVRLVPAGRGVPPLHLPVAFVPQQGAASLTSSCAPGSVRLLETTLCTVTAAPTGYSDVNVSLESTTNPHLSIAGASGAAMVDRRRVEKRNLVLTGAVPGTPSLEQVAGQSYAPLPADRFVQVGDEAIVAVADLPEFRFNGVTYNKLSYTTNGYVVVGAATAEDVQFEPSGISTVRPNNYLAPFWTDLTGNAPVPPTGQPPAPRPPGMAHDVVTDAAGDRWIVVEWRLYAFGSADLRTFQVRIGVNGDAHPGQDIRFSYVVAQATAPGLPYLIGAENVIGTDGAMLAPGALPTGDIRVVSTDPVPGQSVSYTVSATGVLPGPGVLTTTMNSPQVTGETVVHSAVPVTFRRGRWPLD